MVASGEWVWNPDKHDYEWESRPAKPDKPPKPDPPDAQEPSGAEGDGGAEGGDGADGGNGADDPEGDLPDGTEDGGDGTPSPPSPPPSPSRQVTAKDRRTGKPTSGTAKSPRKPAQKPAAGPAGTAPPGEGQEDGTGDPGPTGDDPAPALKRGARRYGSSRWFGDRAHDMEPDTEATA